MWVWDRPRFSSQGMTHLYSEPERPQAPGSISSGFAFRDARLMRRHVDLAGIIDDAP